ncbi:Inositol 2-dehydrogenase/D-chiro-inositol 3-dehydrogenase [Pseudomonas fluorescens]|uniref:Inositol 2-dehydrogenase/D-chiro-inositol 3-dehydrogenase n=1 Tax=Pseudomonas fluorescens TaxID=294 RepID=A0A5E7CH19_PSEFL|nr:Inositol 2-dehydrogenase/D-chiro-inositol 3-dehydrogenase [Pseudomonas fluorescens]
MPSPLRIALIGAGNMGQLHYQHLRTLTEATLCAVADPGPQAAALAAEWGVGYFSDHRQMLEQVKPDAVIVANPNTLHVSTALDCLAVGVPVLLEKPVGVHLDEARELVAASKATGVPVLVGHHRRHNPLIVRARELVQSGTLGRLTTVTALWQLRKPDSYFEIPWRREPGAGMLLTNLIHDLDLLRHLCGEVRQVQAITQQRGARVCQRGLRGGVAAIRQWRTGQPDRLRRGGGALELGAGFRGEPDVSAPGRSAVLLAGRYGRRVKHSSAQTLALRRYRWGVA